MNSIFLAATYVATSDNFITRLFGPCSDQLIYQVVLIGGLFAVFYFIFYRPQKKKEKAVAAMRSSIEIGDEVVTIGGLVGRVVTIKDDSFVIECGSDRTKIKVMKWALQERLTVKSDS
jgi:preprotein translocase subunit YajC